MKHEKSTSINHHKPDAIENAAEWETEKNWNNFVIEGK